MVFSTITWVAAIALILFGVWLLPEKVRRLGRWLGVLFWINLLVNASFLLPSRSIVWVIPAFVAILSTGLFLWKTKRSSDSLVTPLGHLGAILLGIQLFSGLRLSVATPSTFPVPAKNSSEVHRARIVVVVFDELDYQLAFEHRPTGVELKNFDRLRTSGELFRVMRPGSDTRMAMPAMISGRPVDTADGYSERELKLNGSEIWPGNDTIFDVARKAGYHTGIVGTYLRYEQFGDRVDQVKSYRNTPNSYSAVLAQQFNELWNKLPNAVFGLNSWRMNTPYTHFLADYHRELLRKTVEDSKAMLGDVSLDFVFLHLQIPHGPHLFTVTGEPVVDQRPSAYPGSLQKCDEVLGELVGANKFKEETKWLVTSDHNHRDAILGLKLSPYVPLLLFTTSGGNSSLPKITEPERPDNAHQTILKLLQPNERATRNP